MRDFRNTIQILLAFLCYFVGYLIFSNPLVSLAMLSCFWVGVIISVIMED